MQPTAQAVGQRVRRTNQPRRGERNEPNPHPRHPQPADILLTPHRPNSKYGKYQEAWHLLEG